MRPHTTTSGRRHAERSYDVTRACTSSTDTASGAQVVCVPSDPVTPLLEVNVIDHSMPIAAA